MSRSVFICMILPYLLVGLPGFFFGSVPRWVGFIPDLILLAFTVSVVANVIAQKSWALIPLRYVLPFLVFFYVSISGFILNEVSSDTIVAGFRTYFRYVPFFLVPFAFHLSENTHYRNLWWIAFVLVLQTPLVALQRFVMLADSGSGDEMTGSIGSTSAFSLLFASAAIFVLVLFYREKLSKAKALLLGVLFLTPPSLVEVRALPFFVVLGVCAVLFAERKRINLRKIVPTIAAVSTLLLGFLITYDLLYGRDQGLTYLELITNREEALDKYNMTGVTALPFTIPLQQDNQLIAKSTPRLVGENTQVGRFDAIMIPFDAMLPHAWEHLLIGLGIGNVDSGFGSGADYRILGTDFGAMSTTLSGLVWEAGLIGAFAFLFLLAILAKDALRLVAVSDADAQIATPIFAVTLLVGLNLMYSNQFHLPGATAIFFYLAGVCAAQHTRRRLITDSSVMARTQPQPPSMLFESKPLRQGRMT